MRYYDVYRTKEGEAVAIKHGICWPALFLSWIWLARKKMWYGATLHFLLQAVILSFAIYELINTGPDNNIKNIYMSYAYTMVYETVMTMVLLYFSILLALIPGLAISIFYIVGINIPEFFGKEVYVDKVDATQAAIFFGFLIFVVLTLLYSFEFAYGRSISRKGGKRLRRRLRAKSRNDAIDIALAEEGNTVRSDPDADSGAPNR